MYSSRTDQSSEVGISSGNQALTRCAFAGTNPGELLPDCLCSSSGKNLSGRQRQASQQPTPWEPGVQGAQILGWRSQRFLREVEAIRHIVGSLISCIQWLQPKRNF